MDNLMKLLVKEGKLMNLLFEIARIEGEGTPQEVSDRRESALSNFIKKYFPFPYRVTKGNIRDSYGQSSMSIDCILLNPTHPFTTTDEIKYSIILADGVDIAIELKPNLDNENEIHRALEQVKSVKELKRKRTGVMDMSFPEIEGFNDGNDFNYSEKCKENFKRIPVAIFSTKIYENENLFLEKIVSYYETKRIKREHQFDILVVNGNMLILNSRKDFYLHLDKITDEGLIILEYKDLTLAAFLLFLNRLPQSELQMSTPILEHYINVQPDNIRTYRDLNNRLLLI